jgi:hypothetical protein
MSFLSDWRESWNGRKDIKVALIITAFISGLIPGVLCQLLIGATA